VSPRDNERLEYLGDAVLQLITAEYLFKLRPGSKEGEMTQIRSAMVNTNTLAALAEELGLGTYLYLGKGIARGGGRSLRSLLANAFEAVLGAIFLDAGYDAAYHYYLDRFRSLPEPVQDENHKGRLQQVVQERFGQTPYYDSVSSRGGRQREYTAVVYAGTEPLGTGHGMTKQAAEQDAARNALTELSRREAVVKSGRRRRREDRPSEPGQAPELEVQAAPGNGQPAAGIPDAPAPGFADQAADTTASTPEAAAAEPAKARRSRRRRSSTPAPTQAPAADQPLEDGRAEESQPAAPRRSTRQRRSAPRAGGTEPSEAADGAEAPTGSI
jgi:ribonuclease III